MEQLESDTEATDWWKHQLTPADHFEIDHAWAFLFIHKKVERGPLASITGNIIALFNELKVKKPHWKERLEAGYTRDDRKYEHIYQKVRYLTRATPVKKKFPSA